MGRKREPQHTHFVTAGRDTHKHKSGEVVGHYSSLSRARLAVDKLDNEYGAYAYRNHQHPVQEEANQQIEPIDEKNYGR